MFSKEEAKKLRQEFWTTFGQEFPRKWLLYNTKIKELSLKFTVNTKFAQVSINIESNDDFYREFYYEKLWSLETILKTEYISEIILEPEYRTETGKIISTVYVRLENVSIHKKESWPIIFEFLYQNMEQLELFFYEYIDFIKG